MRIKQANTPRKSEGEMMARRDKRVPFAKAASFRLLISNFNQ
jgi:hypothetical protein